MSEDIIPRIPVGHLLSKIGENVLNLIIIVIKRDQFAVLKE